MKQRTIVCILSSIILFGCAGSTEDITSNETIENIDGEWIATVELGNGTIREGVEIVFDEIDGAVNGRWTEPQVPGAMVQSHPLAGHYGLDGLTFAYNIEDDGLTYDVSFDGKIDDAILSGVMTIRSGDRVFGSMNVVAHRSDTVMGSAGTPRISGNAKLASRTFASELDAIVTACGCPGAVAAYSIAGGEVVVSAAGFADREAGLVMHETALMPVGSIGKMFVSALTLLLAREAEFSLDDTISNWVVDEPWFQELRFGKEITIRHLLNHSSGIADHVKTEAFIQDVSNRFALDVESDPDFVYSPESLIRFVSKNEPRFAPGEGYEYSDTGYLILGILIEKITGNSYYDELVKKIINPLDLSLTVPADRRNFAGLAAGYADPESVFGAIGKTAGNEELLFHPLNEWTGGGLVSNSGDLVSWITALFRGELLTENELEELISSVSNENSKYGLGISLSTTRFGIGYGHTGEFPGYRTGVLYLPEYKLALAVQFNTDYHVDSSVALLRLVEAALNESTS